MKKLLYIFVATLSLSLASCCKNDVEEKDTTPQTTLMYMTGTDLSYFFGNNIAAAKRAISSNALGDGRFVVFRHTSSSTANLIEYKCINGECTADTLKSYSSIKSLSLDAITEVVADVKHLAPADNYNLIVSGHATGWVPKSRLSGQWRSKATEEPIDWEAMSQGDNVTRYLGSKNDGYFDVDELQEALSATETRFKYILFDECFMSSVEALYTLRNNCDYIIASPCEIMGDGFPYAAVLPALFTSSGHSFDLKAVCEAYHDYYQAYSIQSGCVALTITEKLEPLAETIRKINSETTGVEVDTEQLQVYERLMNHIFFDLEDYTLAKCGDNEQLKDELLRAMKDAFPVACRLHTKRFYANIGVSASSANNYDAYFTTINYYSGVTTSAPSNQFREEWEATEWAGATN